MLGNTKLEMASLENRHAQGTANSNWLQEFKVLSPRREPMLVLYVPEDIHQKIDNWEVQKSRLL
jgi:hypothetical protein